MKRPEVLAPAGDRPSLEAAVRAGADAVYFGLPGFNARARAHNFELGKLVETMTFLHDHGRKGYVTLNTLVFDDELPALEAAARACAEAGVDAVIVQDLGVARVVKAVAPTLPIHASTQMTCTDAASVELAHSFGADRVILARELSLEDIAAIRAQSQVDLEVFVHGALCISYSGQCLTSEAIGGRSANRGACAQACRLPYQLVVDGELRDLDDRAFLLSPEDLEASALVPRLIELGVSSLKIEGRLKGPGYVAATTALYREAIDRCMSQASPTTAAASPSAGPERDTKAIALQMFSRGSGPGFLAGVDHQRLVEGNSSDHRGTALGRARSVVTRGQRTWLRLTLEAPLRRGDGILVAGGFGNEGEVGGRVWAIEQTGSDAREAAGGEVDVWLGPDQASFTVSEGRRVFLTNAPERDREANAIATREPDRRPLDLVIRGAIGEAAVFVATTAEGRCVQITGDASLAASTGGGGLDEALLRSKVGSLGETPFALRAVTLEIPHGAFIPPASLKRARRALVEALLALGRSTHATTEITVAHLMEAARPPRTSLAPAGLYVVCRNEAQAQAAYEAGAEGIYFDFLELTGTGTALRAVRERARAEGRAVALGVAPPRVRKPSEEKIDRYLASLAPDMMLVRGLGALRELELGLALGLESGTQQPLAIADFSLNAANRLTAVELLQRGAAAFVPSFDLDAGQLTRLLASDLAPFAEVVVHHPMPLFYMEHCAIAALLSEGRDYRTCGRPCDRHRISLRDRAGMDHPVEADVGCRNTVFHARPQSAADLVPTLLRAGVRRYRVELVRETAAEAMHAVSTYRKLIAGSLEPAEVWRALKTEGGYGVVRGSLRVLPN